MWNLLRNRNRAGALALLLALAVPSVSQATLLHFGATGTADIADENSIPVGSQPTTLDIVFSTTGADDRCAACEDPGCIFGWTVTLTTTGSLRIIDYIPGPVAAPPNETSCGTADPGVPTTWLSTCKTLGGDETVGEAGTNIAMFSLTVDGGAAGDQLLWDGDFTESDFSPKGAAQVIATVVPEPTTLALLCSGLGGLALWRKRSH